MPFARPSLTDLITRIGGDLRGRLEVTGPLLRRAMADVLSSVWAGAVHGLYGYLDWVTRQLFGDIDDDDQLLRKAKLYGITPVPAGFASGNVTATGVNGTQILTGTIIKLDAVTSYRVTTGQTISGGVATCPVTAVIAGAAANLPAATALTFESPPAGVQSACVVATGGITNGVDQELVSALRVRFLEHLRNPPTGGSAEDYIEFAKSVPGVTRVWVFPRELGLGTVVVRFVRDLDLSIFPDGSAVAAVQAAENAGRPITAAVTVAAPTALAVAFTLHIVPDTADTRAAVSAELADLLTRVGEPGDGVSRGKILLSVIRTTIGVAAGVSDYTLTVPAADVVPGVGQLPVLGTITFT